MSKVLITESILQDTADAIREKLGSQDSIKPSEFADLIVSIPSSGGSDYQRVEYIQSSGAQYLNTNYCGNGNSQYEFRFSDGITPGIVFGSYNVNWQTGNGFYHNTNSSDYEWFHYYSNDKTYTESGVTKVYTCFADKGKLIINENIVINHNDKTFNLTNPIYIFAGNMAGSLKEPLSCKIYYFRISENNILLHDYVPCYRKADGEIGMYDLVDDIFITNAGTGSFIKGPDIN